MFLLPVINTLQKLQFVEMSFSIVLQRDLWFLQFFMITSCALLPCGIHHHESVIDLELGVLLGLGFVIIGHSTQQVLAVNRLIINGY